MDINISNRNLAMLLLGAVLLSFVGTIISFNRLDAISTVGFQSNVDTATITLEIEDLLSITTIDSAIVDFDVCAPASGVPVNITSENTKNTSTNCPNYGSQISNISVRNNGNVNASVNLSSSNVGNASGGSFMASSSATSQLGYKVTNSGVGYSGGCDTLNGPSADYGVIAQNDTSYPTCALLRVDGTNNSFVTNFEIVIPNDVPSGVKSVTITYTATQV